MATKAIVGEKVGMTQIWDEAQRVVPVTMVKVAALRVVRVKTPEQEGYSALQVTYGVRAASKLNKPEAGHFAKAGVEPGVRLVELRLDDTSGYSVGQEINAGILAAGDKIDVTAVSKGKGFAGGMKRHNFKGQGAAHGTTRRRFSGSIFLRGSTSRSRSRTSSLTACPTALGRQAGECYAFELGGHVVRRVYEHDVRERPKVVSGGPFGET